VKINPSVVCELVGDDAVVLDPENSAVVTLTGDSAVVVRRLLAGDTVSDTEPGVDKLLRQGIVLAASSNGLSRRSLVATGAAVGAGGIFALSLPAAANSSSPGGVTELPPPSEPSLLRPEFTVSLDSEDGSYWESTANDTIVELIRIDKNDFRNDDKFPDGFILEWSFFSSFTDPEEFVPRGEPIDEYVWDREENGLTIPGGILDGSLNLTIWVRVRSGTQLSPAVSILLPKD